jgi:hypothetical protein
MQAASVYSVSFNCLRTCCPVHHFTLMLPLKERNAQTKRTGEKNRTNIQFVSLLDALFLRLWFARNNTKSAASVSKLIKKCHFRNTGLIAALRAKLHSPYSSWCAASTWAAVAPVPDADGKSSLGTRCQKLSHCYACRKCFATRIAIHTHASAAGDETKMELPWLTWIASSVKRMRWTRFLLQLLSSVCLVLVIQFLLIF